MSLITNKQQELIDTAISTYIRTHDNLAVQYLKLRTNVIELSRTVSKEVKTDGKITDETRLKLHQLSLENEKLSILYPDYLEKLKNNLDFVGRNEPQYLSQLEEQYAQLNEKNSTIKEKIHNIEMIQKPIVELMTVLKENFDKLLLHKTTKSKDSSQGFVAGKNEKETEASKLKLDYLSTVFSKSELQKKFDDVNTRLGMLRTVDEVNEDGEAPREKSLTIDVIKYLDEVLQNSRAYSRLDDDRYSFDITRSLNVPSNSKSMVISDYEQAEKLLLKEIEDLVQRGAVAKERWMLNSKKVEAMNSVLHSFDDSMDVEK